MLTHVEFRSDKFPSYENEKLGINPSLFGKRLAEFLRDKLAAEGIKTREHVAEDWGWLIPVENEKIDLWIGCGRYQEYPDGFLCFIEPHTSFVRKPFRRFDIRKHIVTLQHAIDKILSEGSGIYAKRWWTQEQFNRVAK